MSHDGSLDLECECPQRLLSVVKTDWRPNNPGIRAIKSTVRDDGLTMSNGRDEARLATGRRRTPIYCMITMHPVVECWRATILQCEPSQKTSPVT